MQLTWTLISQMHLEQITNFLFFCMTVQGSTLYWIVQFGFCQYSHAFRYLWGLNGQIQIWLIFSTALVCWYLATLFWKEVSFNNPATIHSICFSCLLLFKFVNNNISPSRLLCPAGNSSFLQYEWLPVPIIQSLKYLLLFIGLWTLLFFKRIGNPPWFYGKRASWPMHHMC